MEADQWLEEKHKHAHLNSPVWSSQGVSVSILW